MTTTPFPSAKTSCRRSCCARPLPWPTRRAAPYRSRARDLDPLEKDLLDHSAVERLSVEDIKKGSAAVDGQMKRLSSLADIIYVHVDMDVLDPPEVAGHPLTVPGGPTSLELAAALTAMFRYEKAAAFGVASTPSGDADRDGRSRQAAYNLILGALEGVKRR